MSGMVLLERTTHALAQAQSQVARAQSVAVTATETTDPGAQQSQALASIASSFAALTTILVEDYTLEREREDARPG